MVKTDATPATTVEVERAKPVRGRGVAGKTWKAQRMKRASSAGYDGTPVLKKSWKKKQAEREAHREMKEFENMMRQQRRDNAAARKHEAAEREKRRAANELKNTKRQVITKNRTIKLMNKKQLRQLKKTIMGADGEVRLVDAYGGGGKSTKKILNQKKKKGRR